MLKLGTLKFLQYATYSIFAVGAAMLLVGIHDSYRHTEPNQCDMTYMWPNYLPIHVHVPHSRYALFRYIEGQFSNSEEEMKRVLKPSGVPVLFIHGNAGSYKQVRSIGSEVARFGNDGYVHDSDVGESFKDVHTSTDGKFDVYSVDFKEELSGFSGSLLYNQAEFTNLCVDAILQLYGQKQTQVIVIGHSMGGVIARMLPKLDNYVKNSVQTVITLATPHKKPLIMIDHLMESFYEEISKDEDANLVIASINGGFRDEMIAPHLTYVTSNNSESISISTMNMAGSWLEADHQCIVWCNQVVKAVTKCLYSLLDLDSGSDSEERLNVLDGVFRLNMNKNVQDNGNGNEKEKKKKKVFFTGDNSVIDVVAVGSAIGESTRVHMYSKSESKVVDVTRTALTMSPPSRTEMMSSDSKDRWNRGKSVSAMRKDDGVYMWSISNGKDGDYVVVEGPKIDRGLFITQGMESESVNESESSYLSTSVLELKLKSPVLVKRFKFEMNDVVKSLQIDVPDLSKSNLRIVAVARRASGSQNHQVQNVWINAHEQAVPLMFYPEKDDDGGDDGGDGDGEIVLIVLKLDSSEFVSPSVSITIKLGIDIRKSLVYILRTYIMLVPMHMASILLLSFGMSSLLSSSDLDERLVAAWWILLPFFPVFNLSLSTVLVHIWAGILVFVIKLLLMLISLVPKKGKGKSQSKSQWKSLKKAFVITAGVSIVGRAIHPFVLPVIGLVYGFMSITLVLINRSETMLLCVLAALAGVPGFIAWASIQASTNMNAGLSLSLSSSSTLIQLPATWPYIALCVAAIAESLSSSGRVSVDGTKPHMVTVIVSLLSVVWMVLFHVHVHADLVLHDVVLVVSVVVMCRVLFDFVSTIFRK